MAHVFSIPIDDLIQQAVENSEPDAADDILVADADVVIVGSGYGASVAAANIAGLADSSGHQIDVLVLERGSEHSVGEFPNTLGELPGQIRFQRPSDRHPTGNPDAVFDLRIGDDVDVLVGNGLGGGSLINANVAQRPDPARLGQHWPARYRNGGLIPAFEEIEKLLGVNSAAAPSSKFVALERLAGELGATVCPAPWTVSRGPAGTTSTNAVGIPQPNCTDCGNCVTGCNVGAKNTLMMNLIPLAAARGARFVTGANVLTVEPDVTVPPCRWRIRIQRTRSIRTPLEDEHFIVRARYVILAAGALGSTEILLRSRAIPGGLDVSGHLGKRFSTNGDGLGFGFGQSAAVNGLGTPEIHTGDGPGPTISGVAQGHLQRDGQSHPYTLEDAATPASLIRLLGEVTITGAAFGRIGNNRLPAWFDEATQPHDPLAYNPAILRHSQTLLMMSDDQAMRTLSLSAAVPAGYQAPVLADMHRHVLIGALTPGQRDIADAGLRALDQALDDQSLQAALDGGQYVPNPLWRLMASSAGSVLNGTLPGGRGLSVHPLGGCGMGEHPTAAVVNADCQVFRGDGGLHGGLYVMDGAVIPGALATNPFLTIAAVAWCASQSLVNGPLALDGWADRGRTAHASPRPGMFVPHSGDPPTPSARLIIREQMRGRLTSSDPSVRAWVNDAVADGARLFEAGGLVLRFRLAPIDVYGQFAELGSGRVDVNAEAQMFVGPPGAVAPAPAATGSARISLLELDAPGSKTTRRAWKAFRAFLRRRGLSLGGGSGVGLIDRITGFVQVARMHASYRQFRYAVNLTTPAGTTITFTARKRIRWEKDAARLWDALLTMPVETIRIRSRSGETAHVPARLRVDASFMLDQGLIQADEDAPNTVEVVFSALSLLAWFSRCFLQTGFWEFGSPAYPTTDPAPDLTPAELRISRWHRISPVTVPLPVMDGSDRLDLELVRYPQSAAAEPVLLVHGLAQGSGIFNTRHMSRNLARHLWMEGYDVWLLDHRLSNRFDLAFPHYSLDAIARCDIVEAVRTVYERSGQRKVKVFAHCVGAVAMQMAILRGRLVTAAGENLVESVCFNAIHPWVMPSPANLVRYNLGSFVRTWITDEQLDPILRPADKDSALRSTLDRLAFSLARIAEETRSGSERHGGEDRLDNGICDRMTFLYGRMWRHGNLERRVHEHWHELVGRAPADIYQQLYYLIERERILDDDGQNSYLVDANLLAHWRDIPTLFLHGDASDVFNPQSATRSAFRLDKAFRDHEAATGAADLAPVYLKRIPDYGHMDPILGASAHVDAYPTMVDFFAIARQWHEHGARVPAFDPYHEADDPDWHPVTSPETGEILRAAWVDGSRIRSRYWIERYQFNTAPVVGLLDIPDWTVVHGAIDLPDCEPRFTWVDRESDPKSYQPVRLTIFQADAATAWAVVAPLQMSAADTLAAARRLISEPRRTASAIRPTPPPAEPPSARSASPPTWHQRLASLIEDAPGARDRTSFLVGSCRYPGTPMERTNADRVFAGMRNTARHEPVDLAIFVGDQIYADAYANIFEPGEWRELYHRGYREAFRTANLRELMTVVPVHFAIDDHEIVDNFSGTRDPTLGTAPRSNLGPQVLTPATIHRDQVKFAVTAARSFMNAAREHTAVGGAPKPLPGSMWYALDHTREVNFPGFVLDTRVQRELRSAHRHHRAATHPHMMDQGQRQALTDWLLRAHQDQPTRPKFVFAGQIVAPLRDTLLRHPSLFRLEEGFFGYPATLSWLVKLIVERQITDVVFVGGDLHLSCAAQIEFAMNGHPPVNAWQIVASGLYAPLPFANANPAHYTWKHDHGGMLAPALQSVPPGAQIRYRAELLAEGRPHFLQVSVLPENVPGGGSAWRIDVAARDVSGTVITPAWRFDETAGNTRLRFV